MFVYNKQKSRIDNAETSRNKYEKNKKNKNYESKFRIGNTKSGNYIEAKLSTI